MSGANPLAAQRAGIPSLPSGAEVGSYATYLEAQRAVDHLSDEGFPVQQVSIVGSDLRSVERVTGRLTYARAALAGAASGLWFGLFAGLLISLLPGSSGSLWLAAILIGAGFGMLFGVIGYALTGGRRDFTSVQAVLAARYTVVCTEGEAGRARQLLAGLEGLRPLPPTAPTAPSTQQPGAAGQPPTPPPAQQG